jgi:hypothetical protein
MLLRLLIPHELIHDPVRANRSADGHNPEIWWIDADEVVLGEALEFVVPTPAVIVGL